MFFSLFVFLPLNIRYIFLVSNITKVISPLGNQKRPISKLILMMAYTQIVIHTLNMNTIASDSKLINIR